MTGFGDDPSGTAQLMPVELSDVIAGIALHAVALTDAISSALHHMYAAGAPDGLGAGGLAAGGAAATVAGGAAAASAGPESNSSRASRGLPPHASTFTDGDGNDYVPGTSPIPENGVVYTRLLIKYDWGKPATLGPHPVDPNTGKVITPKVDSSLGPGNWISGPGAARG